MKLFQADTDAELKKLKTVIEDEKESKTLCLYEVEKLRAMVQNSKKTKEHWKNVIIELTKTLEEKIQLLLLENENLRASQKVF